MSDIRPDSAWSRTRHIPGLTYRRLDHWCTKGYVHVTDGVGSGSRRTITDHEIRVLTYMVDLVTFGLAPATAEPIARTLALGISVTFGGFQIRRMAL